MIESNDLDAGQGRSFRFRGWRSEVQDLSLAPFGPMRRDDDGSEARIEDRHRQGGRAVEPVKCHAVLPDAGASLDDHQRSARDLREARPA